MPNPAREAQTCEPQEGPAPKRNRLSRFARLWRSCSRLTRGLNRLAETVERIDDSLRSTLPAGRDAAPEILRLSESGQDGEEGAGEREAVPKQPHVQYSRRLAAQVLALLEEVDRRLTLTEMVDELAARGDEWSLRSFSSCCPKMREAGLLTNVQKPDHKGKGYGLPKWDLPSDESV